MTQRERERKKKIAKQGENDFQSYHILASKVQFSKTKITKHIKTQETMAHSKEKINQQKQINQKI